MAWAGLGTQASQPSGRGFVQSFHNVPHLISVHVGHPDDDDDGQEMMGDVATSSLETTADQIVRPVYRLVSPLHESEHNLEHVFDTERQLRDGVEKSQTRSNLSYSV